MLGLFGLSTITYQLYQQYNDEYMVKEYTIILTCLYVLIIVHNCYYCLHSVKQM